MTKDPVCGMEIDEAKAAGKSECKDNTYYFCSQSCKAAFEKDPDMYAARSSHDSNHGLRQK
jgi:YHS domain-containing protein